MFDQENLAAAQNGGLVTSCVGQLHFPGMDSVFAPGGSVGFFG